MTRRRRFLGWAWPTLDELEGTLLVLFVVGHSTLAALLWLPVYGVALARARLRPTRTRPSKPKHQEDEGE